MMSMTLEPRESITGFPENKEALENLQKNAKMHSNGSVFITWTAERPGNRVGVIYPDFVDVFTIFIFTNDKGSDLEIIKLYESIRNILQKEFYLYYGEMSPVKTSQTGLWMAAIQVGKQNIYQGTSDIHFKV
ncbi:hypothetical protein MASR1M45_12580 [Candidatus Kapaibacterium sp.]